MVKSKPTVAHSDYIRIWDNKKNTIDPDSVTLGSAKKTWWLCSKGHSYDQAVNKKVRAGLDSCPVCNGRRIITGVNDLATLFPKVVQWWDKKKNTKSPETISAGSESKVWWLCEHGHSYQQMVVSKTQDGHGCPVCSNQIVIAGVNDIFTTHPEVKEIWDKKNNTTDLTTVSSGTEKKLWWLCENGHSYQQSGYSKTVEGKGCLVCAGKKTQAGYNDIPTTFPQALEDWDYTKNDLPPEKYTRSSNKEVWWVCSKKHSYKQSVNVHWRTRKRATRGCPICANRIPTKGENDLLSQYPTIAELWDYEKNKLKPYEVTPGSHAKIHWVCPEGHKFQRAVKAMVHLSPDCIKCKKAGTSKMEQEVSAYVKEILFGVDVVENTRKIISPYELDIYIPDKNIAIEFNGLYWHSEQAGKTRNYHKKKWEKCQEKGVQLITVWEDDWRDKKGVVKSMLAHKLGVSGGARVFARKTVIKPVDSATARKFCDSYHIQGACGGTCYLGLYTKNGNELVAMSVWRKNKKDIYLDRYCTSQTVVGGFSKLLKHATALFTQDGFDRIVTFADREVSDGRLYERTGFKLDSYLKPDYRYVRDDKRYHKFGFRLKRFKNDPELLYKEGLTEGQLAELNGMIRVWDCGKIKYVMELK